MVDLLPNLLAGLDFHTLPEQLLNGLFLGAIYALIALGYTMVYGVLRLINFAHGEVYMLGAYVALLVSYGLGFSPDVVSGTAQAHPAAFVAGLTSVLLFVGIALAAGTWMKERQLPFWAFPIAFIVAALVSIPLGKGVDSLVLMLPNGAGVLNLILMLLTSMIVCATIGVIIERFAYRPMRGHSRISALITAIGVSLFLQYFGALFLPNSPPPSISENVNPFRGSKTFTLVPPNASFTMAVKQASPAADQANQAFNQYLASHPSESLFSLKPEGQTLKDAKDAASRKLEDAKGAADASAWTVTVRYGEVIIFVTSIILMIILTYLVMFTKRGRAMRAVALDFDSASLMGIDVNSIITFTFIIGSSLAGAGAMMQATFKGTTLTTFFGVLPGVKAFVAAVLGGIGNIPGAVMGGLLMGMAETLMVWVGLSRWADAIAFVILIAVLLFRPGGILGSSAVEKV